MDRGDVAYCGVLWCTVAYCIRHSIARYTRTVCQSNKTTYAIDYTMENPSCCECETWPSGIPKRLASARVPRHMAMMRKVECGLGSGWVERIRAS